MPRFNGKYHNLSMSIFLFFPSSCHHFQDIIPFHCFTLKRVMKVMEYHLCNDIIRWHISKFMKVTFHIFMLVFTVSDILLFQTVDRQKSRSRSRSTPSAVMSFDGKFQNLYNSHFAFLRCISYCFWDINTKYLTLRNRSRSRCVTFAIALFDEKCQNL